TGQPSEVIRFIHRALSLPDEGEWTDGQLLENYLVSRDESALTILVQRHAAMVWGVCRRTVRDCRDAEDAFQATFLILVKKATSIVPREMVANWLYGVARRTALKAREIAAKRRARERPIADLHVLPQPVGEIRYELHSILDQELSGLPDKYRTVIVLCDL